MAWLRLADEERLGAVTVWDHLMEFSPPSLSGLEDRWGQGMPNFSEHEVFEWQVLLGAMARAHDSIRIGVGVTESIRRHPVVLAQAALTLSHISNVPPILGLGAGERANTEPYGLDPGRGVSRLEEAVQVVRLCLHQQGPIEFVGQHFVISGGLVDLRPPEGRTPEIWIGARGPRMLELAGRYADGWYPADLVDPAGYAARLEVVRRTAVSAGRRPSDILPAAEIVTFLADTEREARVMLESREARMIGLLLSAEDWAAHGLTHPFGEGYRGFADFQPLLLTEADVTEALDAVPSDLVGAHAFWGTATGIGRQILKLAEAGLRHANLSMAGSPQGPEGVEAFRPGIRAIRCVLEEAT